MLRTGLLALTLTSSVAFAQDVPTEPSQPTTAAGQYVGLVIGISSYQNLPEAVELDFARSDASMVYEALRNDAGFKEVFTLTDRQATKAGIEKLMREDIAQLVGPNDFFLLYFVGHGIGADFELPTLLAHDSTIEEGLKVHTYFYIFYIFKNIFLEWKRT